MTLFVYLCCSWLASLQLGLINSQICSDYTLISHNIKTSCLILYWFLSCYQNNRTLWSILWCLAPCHWQWILLDLARWRVEPLFCPWFCCIPWMLYWIGICPATGSCHRAVWLFCCNVYTGGMYQNFPALWRDNHCFAPLSGFNELCIQDLIKVLNYVCIY